VNVDVLYGNENESANANDDMVLKTKMAFVMRHAEIERVLGGDAVAVAVAEDGATVESGDIPQISGIPDGA
jgi:hypothetical protein